MGKGTQECLINVDRRLIVLFALKCQKQFWANMFSWLNVVSIHSVGWGVGWGMDKEGDAELGKRREENHHQGLLLFKIYFMFFLTTF